ncbi:MAG: universal stress protein [Natrialbaceae archaeon]|nr:universal stress protein [Natrialbaceae archaeon]
MRPGPSRSGRQPIDLEVERVIRGGPPAHAIISYAVESEIDLIVMGTHGRTGYERYLLGSVAERVVRSAPMPVMTVALEPPVDTLETLAEGLPSRVAREDEW